MGEVFKCNWTFNDSKSELFIEQVSHHPPISAFYFRNHEKNILCSGQVTLSASLHPFSNSASSSIIGTLDLKFLNLDEEYKITYPSVCVKGVFYGTVMMENSGESSIECKKTGYKAIFEWKENVDSFSYFREMYKQRFLKKISLITSLMGITRIKWIFSINPRQKRCFLWSM